MYSTRSFLLSAVFKDFQVCVRLVEWAGSCVRSRFMSSSAPKDLSDLSPSLTLNLSHCLGRVVEVLGWGGSRAWALCRGGSGVLSLGPRGRLTRRLGGLWLGWSSWWWGAAVVASETGQELALTDTLQVQVAVVVLTTEGLRLQSDREQTRRGKIRHAAFTKL